MGIQQKSFVKMPIDGCVSNLWHSHKLCIGCEEKTANNNVLSKINYNENKEKYNKNKKQDEKDKNKNKILIIKY